ncbi:hypothetical protein [Planktosalinus lacus]|uniref:Lipoprotein n=1 Tax=Planktosalinus lacus TaxID=1526573 RepID=A0A8J2Y7B8_9FLAO|nr:hypothetical protein [Planktosalinus lacus]GGD80424.1 hypothetical protein GCM10011312_00910 [Planktosalinus lacus]
MKQLILSIAAVAVFSFTSCSSDDDGGTSCEQLLINLNAAAEAWIQNPESQSHCNDYRASIEAFMGRECTGSDAYASLLAELSCSDL